ncbi:MAG: YggS family pyridoxal phosphate-dependent enzyme [Sphingobacteriales bacterium]|nr:YggS family pyridoxal phosphate-dependent enzyme [Sphingobacteriales bacterium]
MPFQSSVYNSLKEQIDTNVTIVAVSKTKPIADLQDAYDIGVHDFGENYVQELVDKYETLPKDIRWHFIGHLQSNKVKYIAPFVHLIHGVDSEKLLIEINKQGEKLNKKIFCLLQIYIAKEETKFGLNEAEIENIIQILPQLPNIKIVGMMGMASFSSDNQIVKNEFDTLKNLFDKYATLSTDNFKMETLSMGMSGDYKMAISSGSNLIRIGSILFGERSYKNK